MAEADSLLAGLDGFLLEILGVMAPPKDDRRVFAVTRAELQAQERLNADYFHPERLLALRSMKTAPKTLNCTRLGLLVNFIREQIMTPGPNYLGLAHVQIHTGELGVQTKNPWAPALGSKPATCSSLAFDRT